MIKLLHGDCLELMGDIPDGSIDMVCADPPYGTTACKWDSIIPLELMWAHLKRIVKLNGAIVMTATQPFSSLLGASNISELRYSFCWHKSHTGQLNAKRMPLKNIEDVLVFYSVQPVYNPQFTPGIAYSRNRKAYKGSECYGEQTDHSTVSTGKRYPKQDIYFKTRPPGGSVYPTQKPVPLMEYLIRTYTNEGETVLDFAMGSGTTGVACVNLNRKFIGIEKTKKGFGLASGRINNAISEGE